MGNGIGLRERLGVSDDYVRYCREERNFAAVLYHLLLDEGRLGAFLELIGLPASQAAGAGIYFEYAHLRDLWAEVGARAATVGERNERYRDAIIGMLAHPEVELPTDSRAFNEFFIGHGSKAASAHFIQMPARWNDAQFQAWSTYGKEFAKRACTLKWAFNAKPDLVLHLADGRVVCVEAKLESAIGAYKARTGRISAPFGMAQTRLQEFIFNDLLGYTTDFVMVSKDSKRVIDPPWHRYTWHEVFSALLREPCASRMVREFRESKFIQPA